MANEQHNYSERRSGTERRVWICRYEFPIVDSHGELVTENRRKTDSDRRSLLTITANNNNEIKDALLFNSQVASAGHN